MDIGTTRKPSSRFGRFSSKQLAFFAIAGLALVVGIVFRAVDFSGEPAQQEKAPVAVEAAPPAATPSPDTSAQPKSVPPPAEEATAEPVPAPPPAARQAPPTPSEPTGQATGTPGTQPQTGAIEQADPSQPGAGMILVARKPVELRSGPSASAAVLFGFPAGRPFRVIGREGGFAHIKDLRSSASGWIDEAALTAPPPRAPAVSMPQGRKSTTAANPKAKATKKETTVADEPARPAAKRPGLFGQGSIFGTIFGNDN